eukprot:2096648-Pyramimonas_sp.AAC.1
MRAFLKNFRVEALYDRVRKQLKGFGGSGFRAKEVLSDVLDKCDLFIDRDADRENAKQQYHKLVVIGIGPCRTANWLFNQPFDYMEDEPADVKDQHYIPVL